MSGQLDLETWPGALRDRSSLEPSFSRGSAPSLCPTSIFSQLGAQTLAAGTLPAQCSSAEQNVPLSQGLVF